MTKKQRRAAKRDSRRLFTTAEARVLERPMREAAASVGVRLTTLYHDRGNRTAHWFFTDAAGRRLLDWWPASGKWWRQATGERGVCVDVDELVVMLRPRAHFPEGGIS